MDISIVNVLLFSSLVGLIPKVGRPLGIFLMALGGAP